MTNPTARTAASTATAATRTAGTAAGAAARRAGTTLGRAGMALEERSVQVAPAVGAAVGTALEAAVDAVGTAAEVAGGVAGALSDTVAGLVEEPGVRVGAAVDALRGARVGPPVAVPRWPWALAAAVLGAAAGAGLAWLLQRLQAGDRPDAQEPHELRAVVDLPAGPADRHAEDAPPSAS